MSISKIETVSDYFQLPISFLEEKSELSSNIIDELELVKNADPSGNSIYSYAFQPKTTVGKKVLEQFPKHYTTNIKFLKDNQTLLKQYKFPTEPSSSSSSSSSLFAGLDNMTELWDEIKNDTGFKEKYYYLDWSYWEYLNKSEPFLQAMSMYNMVSPAMSLLIPVIILIIPFFIIKSKGLDITTTEYLEILKVIASNHAIGRIFTQFNKVGTDQKIYLLVSAAFYLFSIYQNVLVCIRFHKNMHHIHSSLKNVNEYIKNTLDSMDNFLSVSNSLNTFKPFNDKMQGHMVVLKRFKTSLDTITGEKLSMRNISEIGRLLKSFYELYDDNEYNETFMYTFGFHGYIDNLEGIIQNVKEKNMATATFKNKSKQLFKKAYYAPLMKQPHVKNTISLEKNITITGPNASGKTTILKTTLINLVLSQQIGCGFYKSANIIPYKHIHCYFIIFFIYFISDNSIGFC